MNRSHAYCASYLLFDELTASGKPITFNYFIHDKKKALYPPYLGDILRIHRVRAIEYNGQLQLVGKEEVTSLVICSRRRDDYDGCPMGKEVF